jgi:hypothetical protein
MYVVLTVAEVTTEEPVVVLSPVAGDQVKVVPATVELAVSVAVPEEPQITPDVAVTIGYAFT